MLYNEKSYHFMQFWSYVAFCTRQDAFAAIDSYLSKAQNQNNQNDLSIANA